MRKIESVEEIEKRQQKRVKTLTIFLLLILLASTAGYAFISNPLGGNGENTDSGTSTDINSEVRNIGGQWAINLNGQLLTFSNSPESVKNISVVEELSISQFSGKPLYIASENEAVFNEIAINLGKYASRTQKACHGKCSIDLPEKDCSDNLIIHKQGSENKVYQNESCVFIEGDMEAADAFLYKLFAIN